MSLQCRVIPGIYARGHVGAATLRRALERMDAAWPEGEEHMAAMIGLWARRGRDLFRAQQQLAPAPTSRKASATGRAASGTSCTHGAC